MQLDCMALISAWRLGFRQAMHSDSPHACIWRSIAARYGNAESRVKFVTHTKAHRSLSQVEAGSDMFNWRGNACADDLCKKGAAMHPDNSDDIEIYINAKSKLIKLARYMSKVIADTMFDFKKPPRLTGLPENMKFNAINEKDRHVFSWIQGRWTCEMCLYRTLCPSSVHNSNMYCHGSSPLSSLLSNDRQGHKLWAAYTATGARIIYCVRCWGYAEKYPRNLAKPCGGRGVSHVGNVYLRKFRHPGSRALLKRPHKV